MTINVLYLIDRLNTGGTELQLFELIRGLDRKKVRPHVCVLNQPEGVLFEKLDALEVPKYRLRFKRFHYLSTIAQILMLTKIIRQNKIHILQAFFQDPCLLAALSKPFHSARLIGSFRDMGFWRTPMETLKMRLAYLFFDGFIANSKAVKRKFVKDFSLDPEKIDVIYNAVQGKIDKDTLDGKEKTNQTVGIVANLNRPVKRLQDFIEAAGLIHQKLPHVRFCVVGGGHLIESLKQQAKRLGLDENICFTGLVANPMEYIDRWSVGVITSESEGFCNAILEYMACGLPVVATDVGGNPELVDDGLNGFLVPSGKPDKLAERILYILKDVRLCSKIGQRNREKIKSDYSLQAMSDKHFSRYASLIGKPFETETI